MFQACGNLGVGKLAEAIHSLIIRCGLNANVIVAAALNSYAKLESLKDSCKVFSKLIGPEKVS